MKISKENMKVIASDVFDMLSFLVFVAGIVFFFRFFVASPYNVVGSSMAETFKEGDFIVVDKVSPKFKPRKRGDIIVFVPPGKDVAYIKRIIGLPGDTVKVEDGKVKVCTPNKSSEDKNGKCEILDESSYVPSTTRTEAKCGQTEFYVSTGGFFVMGDNRGFTTDSLCCFGIQCFKGANYLVPYKNIIGKVYMRLVPDPQVF